jgi:hypothetical protein
MLQWQMPVSRDVLGGVFKEARRLREAGPEQRRIFAVVRSYVRHRANLRRAKGEVVGEPQRVCPILSQVHAERGQEFAT